MEPFDLALDKLYKCMSLGHSILIQSDIIALKLDNGISLSALKPRVELISYWGIEEFEHLGMLFPFILV